MSLCCCCCWRCHCSIRCVDRQPIYHHQISDTSVARTPTHAASASVLFHECRWTSERICEMQNTGKLIRIHVRPVRCSIFNVFIIIVDIECRPPRKHNFPAQSKCWQWFARWRLRNITGGYVVTIYGKLLAVYQLALDATYMISSTSTEWGA